MVFPGSSLQPLKRDPLPSGVPVESEQSEVDLFAETDAQVDQRTIDIVASAGQEPSADSTQVAGETSEATAAEAAAEEAVAVETTAPAAESQASGQAQPIPQPKPIEVASVADKPATGRLEIQTNSEYRQIDIWLREAYAAYQAGNDELALQRYNQVLEVDPRNRNALLARAAIHVQNADIDAAIADYQALLLANPKDSLAMSSLLGVASLSPQETETRCDSTGIWS